MRQLTDREQQVMVLLCRGRSNRQIATELAISPRTVKSHVVSIFLKMDVSSRHVAVAHAHRDGIVPAHLLPPDVGN